VENHTGTLAELRELLGNAASRWEAWVGLSGVVYARRRRTSPAVLFRGVTAEAVAKQIHEYEEGRS
jgi:hypothetical protein